MKRIFQTLSLFLSMVACLTVQPFYAHSQSLKGATDPRPQLPIDYISNYNLAEDGTSFVTQETSDKSGYFSYSDANERFAHCTIGGVAYHLPSSAEWNGILSSYYENGVNFIQAGLIQNEIEPISFGDIRNSFASDYCNVGNGITYALRLCKPTEAFNDNFPAAPDNRYRCAYRYERVGMMQQEQQPPQDAFIKVSVYYLGEDFTGTISDISNEEWWDNHKDKVEECIVPTIGVKVAGKLYNYASGGFYWATDKAKYTSIFYSGISTSMYPDKSNLCNVRLFKDKTGEVKPQKPTITVTPNAFRIKVGQELDLNKGYHVDITPAEYVGKYTVTSSKPEIVSYDANTNKIKGVAVGEAVLTFQINDTEVSQEVEFTVVPKEGELEIKHPVLPDVQDFPDLSMLTKKADVAEIKAFETTLGLRHFESTLWDENAHLYVTSSENIDKTNFNRVNYYYNPKDGGSPYITGQINCVGSLSEAEKSQDFAKWLKKNGFSEPLEVITLQDKSKALCVKNQELVLKFWIEKKIFFMIIEPIKKGNAITAPAVEKLYTIYPIPAKDALHISGMEAGIPIALYTMDGSLVYQTSSEKADTVTIATDGLANGVYILLIKEKPFRITIAK